MAQSLGMSKNTAKLHQVFGKKLYSDKYAFISEICQNAVDSHRRAGVEVPVKVGVKDVNGKWWMYVKDVGVGFDSIEDFEKKVCTLLESDKSAEKTNDASCQMGNHGIGSISVSKYSDFWHYTVAKAGRIFKATLREKEAVGLIHDCDEIGYDTCYDEHFVLFECPVQEGRLEELITAMVGKLAYFKDILFEFDHKLIAKHKSLLTINTEFKLNEADDFTISTLSNNKQLHIVLDQYCYEIKWAHLGIRPIPLNVGLRFGMADGLEADLTRENLQINDNYKSIIMDKIVKVSTWFIKKYNDTIPDEYTNIHEYAKAYKATKGITLLDKFYEVGELAQYSEVKYKELEFKDVQDNVIGKFVSMMNIGKLLFKPTHIISNGKKKGKDQSQGTYWDGKQNFLIKGKPSRGAIEYLKTYKEGAILYTKTPLKFKDRSKGSGYSYNFFMNLSHGKAHMKQVYTSMGVNIWREKIKQMQILEDLVEKELFTIVDENFVIPEEAKHLRKQSSARRSTKLDAKKLEGDVSIKYSMPTLVHTEWACKFETKLVPLADLYKQPKLHVYATEDDRAKLDLLYELSVKDKNITPCIINKTQQEVIKTLKLHNFMDINSYFEGKHKSFRKIMTAHFIKTRLLDVYKVTFDNSDLIKQFVCSKFANDMEMLEEYTKKYQGINGISGQHSSVTLALEEVANTNKLYDEEVWHIYNQVLEEIEKFDFVEFFSDVIRGYGSQAKDELKRASIALQDVARQRSIRMDWKYYQLFDCVQAADAVNK